MIEQIMRAKIEEATNTKDRLFNIGILLFASKGYHAVGIREICKEASIKESSFYNHFKGKAALLDEILDRVAQRQKAAQYTEDEIEAQIQSKNIDQFIEVNMLKFADAYGFPEFHPALLVVYMERFTHETAHEIMKNNAYNKWKEPMERILNGFINNGTISKIDVEDVVMTYYYALTGIVEEYIQLLAWGEDFMAISNRIQELMDYYKRLLRL